MNSFDKYLLLGSLSFFFGSLAISLISFYDPGTPSSYMYTPSPIETATDQAPENDARQYHGSLPKSVLHYPADGASDDSPPTCRLEAEYTVMITAAREAGATLAVTAAMSPDRLEIYTMPDGTFKAYVIGPDALGNAEACEVAEGTDWKPAAP